VAYVRGLVSMIESPSADSFPQIPPWARAWRSFSLTIVN